MQGTLLAHRCLKWTVRTLTGLLLGVVILVAVVVVYADHARGPLVRFVSERTGRQIQVDGAFRAHLFSLHPRVTAERVRVGNPPWMPAGSLAEIGRLSVQWDLPSPRHSFSIRRLELEGATVRLLRLENGYSNWRWTAPGSGPGTGPPLIRGLSMVNASVALDDARRHLRFRGKVSAQDAIQAGHGALEIKGAGELNGKPANFAVNGDPLATVALDTVYRFAFDERSSGSRLSGRGFLPHPLDFRWVDARFEAAGEDMKDLYFLTGAALPETGRYKLSGHLVRERRLLRFEELAATSGQSDMRGTLAIESSKGHSHLDVDLRSEVLRMADLGQRAAGRAPEAPPSGRKLPDIELNLKGIRKSDADVEFHARTLVAGRVAMHMAAAKINIDNGVLTVESLSATVFDGKITGRARFDATHDSVAADVDLKLADLQLDQFDRKGGPAPFEGKLRGRLTLTGQGKSLHDLAATSNGTVTAVLPHGAIRASFAELAGLDLGRGLGLMATHDKKQTGVRCAVASFQAHDGLLTARSLLVDTDPVVITGEGEINLGSEALDLRFRGQPKKMRLMRVRSPISMGGTLAHPSVRLDAGKSMAQLGGAVALGVLLTPLAAVLAYVDPGLAQDADCAAVIADASSPASRAEVQK